MNYQKRINEFKESLKEKGILKIIAFSGSCSKDLEEKAKEIVKQSFEIYKTLPVAIQTGGTEWDIQKFAAEQCDKHSIPLIGIFPSRGEKYKLKNLDFALEVEPRYSHSEWGDESEIYAKLPDGVELIGGSMGTLVEISHILKINDGRIRKNETPIYIAPVPFEDTDTIASQIYQLPIKDGKKASIREYNDLNIENGESAALYLKSKLF